MPSCRIFKRYPRVSHSLSQYKDKSWMTFSNMKAVPFQLPLMFAKTGSKPVRFAIDDSTTQITRLVRSYSSGIEFRKQYELMQSTLTLEKARSAAHPVLCRSRCQSAVSERDCLQEVQAAALATYSVDTLPQDCKHH